jgi:hypothetical protein
MATTPTTADGGALAITPARVNIFAKPAARQSETSRDANSSGRVFDDAAACRSADDLADCSIAGSDDRPGLRSVTAPRRRACLLGLAAATACLLAAIATHDGRHRAPSPPPLPSLRQSQEPRALHVSNRRPAPRRIRERRGPRPHHPTRRPTPSTSTTQRTPTRVRQTPAPNALHSVTPRGGPGASAPRTRAVPAPVPRAAPPEFM